MCTAGGGGGAVRTPCPWPSRAASRRHGRHLPSAVCNRAACRDPLSTQTCGLQGSLAPLVTAVRPEITGPQPTRCKGDATPEKKKKGKAKRNGGQHADSDGAAQATRPSRPPHADRHETDELYTAHTTDTQGTQNTQPGTRPTATPAGAGQTRGRGNPHSGRAGARRRGVSACAVGPWAMAGAGGGAPRAPPPAAAAADSRDADQARGGGTTARGGGRSVKALVVRPGLVAPRDVVLQQRPRGGAHERLRRRASRTPLHRRGRGGGGGRQSPVEHTHQEERATEGRRQNKQQVSVGSPAGRRQSSTRGTRAPAGECRRKRNGKRCKNTRPRNQAAYLPADFALNAHGCPVCKKVAARPRRALATRLGTLLHLVFVEAVPAGHRA